MSEPKYGIRVDCDKRDILIPPGWAYDGMVTCSPPFDTWDAAMAKAVELGIGRSTSEAGTFELDPGVEIKAVRE